MVEPWVLQIATTLAPCSRACRTAMSVSIVSPDCEMRDDQGALVDHRVAVAELVRQLDLDRDPAPVLDRVLGDLAGVGGACRRRSRRSCRRSAAPTRAMRSSSSTRCPSASVRPSRVSATACGLLVDLLLHEGRVAALLGGRGVPVHVVLACVCAGAPSKPVTATASGVMVTTWSWPSSMASRVYSMNAATSEPRKFSPSPRPTTSGELRRAPTTTPGSSACTASRVNAPSSRLQTARIASVRSPSSS